MLKLSDLHSLSGRTFVSEGSTGEYRPQPLDYEVPRPQGAGLDGIPPAPLMERHEHLLAVRAGLIGSVHSWELVTAVDGPGSRMTVFLAGCPLRCLYCHNPDTLNMRRGTPVMFDDLISRIERYKPIFRATGGGVTFSGGEPTMQPAFLGRLLAACRQQGIHTAVDTSGFLGTNVSDEMLNNISLVLLDVKSGDEETYHRTTKQTLAPTLQFGDRLARAGIPAWIRFVLVPGLTDAPSNIENVAKIVSNWPNVERVEVLPFHQMARDKWDTLGMKYELDGVEPPSNQKTEEAREIFRSHGLVTL